MLLALCVAAVSGQTNSVLDFTGNVEVDFDVPGAVVTDDFRDPITGELALDVGLPRQPSFDGRVSGWDIKTVVMVYDFR